MSDNKYIVRGGVFTDTSFKKLESKEERYGPFDDYGKAYDQWNSATRWNLDTCCHRLFIEPYHG